MLTRIINGFLRIVQLPPLCPSLVQFFLYASGSSESKLPWELCNTHPGVRHFTENSPKINYVSFPIKPYCNRRPSISALLSRSCVSPRELFKLYCYQTVSKHWTELVRFTYRNSQGHPRAKELFLKCKLSSQLCPSSLSRWGPIAVATGAVSGRPPGSVY